MTKKAHDYSMLGTTVKKFIQSLEGGKPIYTLTPQEARNVLINVQKNTPVTLLPADIEEKTIPVGPKGSVKIRIVRPQNNKQNLPIIIYMHGGGWILGNVDTHDRLVREIAHGAQAAVVFVEYTLAPEGQYPTAHEEGYAVVEWIAKNGAALQMDTTRMAIAGDSVGGLMATAIALMCAERKGPQFMMQLLLYPVTDANFETKSYQEFATGYFLERAGMQWFWDAYVPDKSMRKNPLVTPLNASLDQLKQLPPALITVHECDVLRDEGEAYAHKLIAAGVPVIGCRYLGVTHDSCMLNPLADAPTVRAMIAQSIDTLKAVFENKNSPFKKA
ncbi:MAG: alpha/beta hydrolase [Candidatus Babeliales bacterium]